MQAPHYQYLIPWHITKPRGKYQPSRANSKISYKVGNWHSSPPQRRGTAAAGQRRRLRTDLITAFKICTGLLDIDSNVFFLTPARRCLRGHTYNVLQGANHRLRRESAFSMGVAKYWNKLPASVVTASSVNVFKKILETIWTEVFPH